VQEQTSNPIVLYDGVCGLCNRLVQFLVRRDVRDRLLFASLQSQLAAILLERHRCDPRDLDTVYIVVDPNQPTERIFVRSDAILHALQQIGGVWRLAMVVKVVPKFIRDAIYNLVARNRYRVFGKHETCLLPEPKYRRKFVGI
jgi:predicted DCC family thiol-disulfide oxidoreductase YuxK